MDNFSVNNIYHNISLIVISDVKNPKKKYIHHFCYKNENIQNLNKLLWQEIYQSTIEAENKKCDKENVQINAV